MVTKKASDRDGPVSENHQLAITSQGPSIVAAARAQRRGRDIALRNWGCCTPVCGVEGESLSTV